MVNTEHCPLKYMYYTVYLTQKQIQSKYSAKYSAFEKLAARRRRESFCVRAEKVLSSRRES